MALSASQIGQRLKEAREKADLSQAAVAKRLGVESVTVSRWERGVRTPPRPATLLMASLYGESPEHFGEEPDESANQPGASLDKKVPRGTSGDVPRSVAESGGDYQREVVAARLARNLPLSVREYLLEVRGRFTRANVPEEMIDEAMDLLRSPSVFSYFKGGKLAEYNEQDVLDGMRTLVDDVVVPRLRKLGFKVRQG